MDVDFRPPTIMNTPSTCTSKRMLDSTLGHHAPSPSKCLARQRLSAIPPRGSSGTTFRGNRRSSAARREKHLTRSLQTHPIHSLHSRLSLVLLLFATLFFGGVSARIDVERRDALVIDTSRDGGARMIGRAATSQDLPTAIIAPTGSATATATASSGSSKTKTVTSAASSPTGISTDSSSSSSSDEMPVPFDGAALSANLTSACSTFLKNSLSDSGFLDCLPLSMLLQNSDSFFQVLTESAFTITKVIDKTCSVNANKCTAIMDKFSGEITTTANCASDYQAGNPIVTQVYNGLVSYLPMYEAGCLKSEEGNYCYVEAITNSDTPGDGAVYFLPLGTQLSSTQEPSAATYSCSKCLVQTMSKFAAAATNTTQPLSHSYNSAADQINTACGDNTVKAGLEIANSAGSTTPAYTAAIAVVLMIAMYIL